MRPLVPSLVLLSLLPASSALPAGPPDDMLFDVPTRPDVTVPVYLMRRSDAVATVALLPGGAGNFTLKKEGPRSDDFLVKNRRRFARKGFTITVVGRPGDVRDLSLARRRTADHLEDVRMVGKSRGSSNGREHHKGRQTRPSPDSSGEGKCCPT